jgi:plasmid stabilization system protein ParE
LLSVEIKPQASLQMERASRWWAENRLAAPGAIRNDIEEAVTLLSQQPGIGARSSTVRHPDLRRLYLSRIKYHVYYRVEGKKLVLAFWHASRDSIPPI